MTRRVLAPKIEVEFCRLIMLLIFSMYLELQYANIACINKRKKRSLLPIKVTVKGVVATDAIDSTCCTMILFFPWLLSS